MARVYIEDLWIDEVNEAKMNAHGIGVAEALSVLDLNRFEVFANPSKDSDAAPSVIVGPSSVRPFVTMPIDPTPLDGVYRPRTAFRSGSQQINEYRRRRPE